MLNTLSVSEILGTIHDGSVEVCATADANYDAAEERVKVSLDAFTRRVLPVGDGRHLSEPWLPTPQQVTEQLPREEALSFTKDVFRSWLGKVRVAVPAELHLRA